MNSQPRKRQATTRMTAVLRTSFVLRVIENAERFEVGSSSIAVRLGTAASGRCLFDQN